MPATLLSPPLIQPIPLGSLGNVIASAKVEPFVFNPGKNDIAKSIGKEKHTTPMSAQFTPLPEPKPQHRVVRRKKTEPSSDFKFVELKCIQYRSYTSAIEIWHFSEYLQSFSDFKKQIGIKDSGYIETRETRDSLHNMPMEKDDKSKVAFTEVLYMQGVFSGKGSAIGFRYPDCDRIEWLCFSKPSKYFLNNARGTNQEPLFEYMGALDKAGKAAGGRSDNRGVRGNHYHRDTFESLDGAKAKQVRVKLLLRGHNWNGLDNGVVKKSPTWGRSYSGTGPTKMRFHGGSSVHILPEPNKAPIEYQRLLIDNAAEDTQLVQVPEMDQETQSDTGKAAPQVDSAYEGSSDVGFGSSDVGFGSPDVESGSPDVDTGSPDVVSSSSDDADSSSSNSD
ncbi:hypothetical protein EJ04DRAFT_589374 [Polyplosphaeria fusca]|uniref:Uncharacterized protein n=1 Tax=Polyplosphaeria fusca TaxID=682080 RepID=A0A9P4QPD9_9PLEO|nr:hypothetical protein EJ04DRAFT_589374 [Polyplosphaeria fusca]